MSAPVEMTRDHWWWRPGWSLGRSFYTWHITFSQQSEIHRILFEYEPAIQNFPTLDPVPIDGLHLTIQGIGFADEVSRSDVDSIVDSTRLHCSKLEPFVVKIGPAFADQETVQMPVRPAEALVNLRSALRAGIGEVWGAENIPESMDDFRPHISLAYSNGAAPIRDIDSSLRAIGSLAAEYTISAVSLIELNRDRKRYEWAEVASVALANQN